jgi:hypothetical protein
MTLNCRSSTRANLIDGHLRLPRRVSKALYILYLGNDNEMNLNIIYPKLND